MQEGGVARGGARDALHVGACLGACVRMGCLGLRLGRGVHGGKGGWEGEALTVGVTAVFEEGACDGDRFERRVRRLRSDNLQRRTVDARARLCGNEHCCVARFAAAANLCEIVPAADPVKEGP